MSEPIHDPKVRYLPTDRGDGWLCEDCGVLVLDKTAHARFHSILREPVMTETAVEHARGGHVLLADSFWWEGSMVVGWKCVHCHRMFPTVEDVDDYDPQCDVVALEEGAERD